MVDLDAARSFILANARILEQRVFGVLFEGGDPGSVVAAVTAYQNPDGGFGHGLEPDKRASTSQPLDVEIAFERLVTAGARPVELVDAACDWLASVADDGVLVPVLLPTVDGFARADHFSSIDYKARPNPTAAIAAHAHTLAATNPWVDAATETCLTMVETGECPTEAHNLLALTRLVGAITDRDRAEAAADVIAAAIPGADYMKLDHRSDGYGVTPLEFAPSPDSIAAAWFDPALIEGHLDELEDAQQPDGGWPISWPTLNETTRWEWRGIRTLSALEVLDAHGRLRA